MDQVEHIADLIASLSSEELTVLRQKIAFLALPSIKPGDSTTQATQPISTPKEKPPCPACGSSFVKRAGKYRGRNRYKCLSCSKRFNDLTATPLAGIHSGDKLREFAARMAEGGESLRKSTKNFDISLSTAFKWRHKILRGYSVAPARKLKGIAEADETFFLYSEKGDKSVQERRKPRKRGGKATKVGISDEQVPVVVGCDRQGEMILGVAGRGRISVKDIEQVLGKRVDPRAVLCTDSHAIFRAFAKANRIKYKPVNIRKGRRIVGKVNHIQHVNSAHTRLKTWMARFKGVSTKRLDNYMQWYGLMEETKPLDDTKEAFIGRSVTQRLRN